MKKIKRSTSYSIAALGLAGALTLSGCGNSGLNSGAYSNPTKSYANSECTASPDSTTNPNYPTTDGTGIHTVPSSLVNRVVGHVFVTCLPSPIQHYLDVELWFHPIEGSGQFEKVAFVEYRSMPNQNNPTDFMVSRWCQPGVWEVRWSVVGKDSVGAPYAFSARWGYAFVKYSDCQKESTPEPTSIHTEGEAPVDPAE
jgi:hypothetical protein